MKQRAAFEGYSIHPLRAWADYVLHCRRQGLSPIFKNEITVAVLILLGVIKTKGEAEDRRGTVLLEVE